jgi:hypothetical protein
MACEISYAAGDSSRHRYWPAAYKNALPNALKENLVDLSTSSAPQKRTEHEQHG